MGMRDWIAKARHDNDSVRFSTPAEFGAWLAAQGGECSEDDLTQPELAIAAKAVDAGIVKAEGGAFGSSASFILKR